MEFAHVPFCIVHKILYSFLLVIYIYILVPTFLFNQYFLFVTKTADNPISQVIAATFISLFVTFSLIMCNSIDRQLMEICHGEFYFEVYNTTGSSFILFSTVGVP